MQPKFLIIIPTNVTNFVIVSLVMFAYPIIPGYLSYYNKHSLSN